MKARKKEISLPLCYLNISEAEQKKARKFISARMKSEGISLQDFSFSFDDTSGIGVGISITFTKTGETQDITDYGRW